MSFGLERVRTRAMRRLFACAHAVFFWLREDAGKEISKLGAGPLETFATARFLELAAAPHGCVSISDADQDSSPPK